jgi:hypothetical protein
VESDCAALVAQVNLMERSKSAIASTTEEIRNILRLFSDFAFSKVHRSCNEVANALARIGRSVLSGHVLLGSIPSCVLALSECDGNHNIVS